MKCDEPKVYKVYTTRNEGAFGFCEGADPTDIELEHESVCLKSDVDKVIAQLKEKLHDVDNQWNEQCKEIAQLKAKLVVLQSFYDLHGNVDNYIDRLKAENESLKAKLETVNELVKTSKDLYDHTIESLKASHYAEMVDAGMRERRLRRALWVTRAAMAKSEKDRWNAHIDCGNKRNRKDPTFIKTGKLLEVSEWRKLWADIERKCLKKAEEFK